MKKRLSWTPHRKGDIYCSSACGYGCLWKDYQATKEAAQSLVNFLTVSLSTKLGAGWKPRVWEDLGWHYEVRCRGLKISVRRNSYTVYIGQWWVEDGKTPKAALRRALETATQELAPKLSAVAAAQAILKEWA